MVFIRRGPLPSSSPYSSASSSNGHHSLSHSESQAPERRREGASFSSIFFIPLANHKSNNINNDIEYHHQHRFFSDINSKLKLTSWKRSLLVRRPVIILFFLVGFFFGIFTCLHDSISISDDHDFHPRRHIQTVSSSSSTSNTTNAAADNDNHDQYLLIKSTKKKKLLIIVTPTYNRALQAYYLRRLSQTLKLVPPPLLWLVVEMNSASIETANLLRTSGVAAYRHLVCDKVSKDVKDRGVHQRNTALEHIERHNLDGIVFFADDDNIYTLRLFDELRKIRRFGTWPVAMLAQGKNKATLEGPVCNGGQVIGWHTNEKSKKLRRFHVDMSGFAFNSTILWDSHRYRRPSVPIRQLDTVKEGFQETTFIEQVVEDEYQMEGMNHNCSVIMNWHIHLDAKHLKYPQGWHVSRNLDAVISLSSKS